MFIPTCQIEHASDRYVKKTSDNIVCSQNDLLLGAIVTVSAFSCSHMQCDSLLLTAACGRVKKPVGRLNKSFLETSMRPIKTVHRGITAHRGITSPLLLSIAFLISLFVYHLSCCLVLSYSAWQKGNAPGVL